MGLLPTLAVSALLVAAAPHVAPGRELSYAAISLPKPGVNTALFEAVEAGLTRVCANVPGLQVKLPDDVNKALKDDARHALVECHGDFACIGGIAGRVGADALMLARVSASNVADGGIVVQFLIINKAGKGVERKAAIELVDAADVDVALRASFLSLFGMQLRGGGVKPPMAMKFENKPVESEMLSSELEAINKRVEDLELSLATLDASEGVTTENLNVLDSLVMASQALVAQLMGVIEQMDASATPRWLRAQPREATTESAPEATKPSPVIPP